MEVWVNASSSCFSNTAGLALELHHEVEGIAIPLTTAANGSAWAKIDIGDALDSSATQLDYASHGLVAKAGNRVGQPPSRSTNTSWAWMCSPMKKPL